MTWTPRLTVKEAVAYIVEINGFEGSGVSVLIQDADGEPLQAHYAIVLVDAQGASIVDSGYRSVAEAKAAWPEAREPGGNHLTPSAADERAIPGALGDPKLGRKTFDRSLQMGARFKADAVHYVFSRRPPPASVPAGVNFVTESIGAFAERLRTQAGKNIWMMGGGEIIGSFLDEAAIDEFIITVVPTFIGEGIPLLAPRHRDVALRLLGVQQFPDGVVQLHYEVQPSRV